MATKLHVKIGQVKIGRAGQSLEAILGSCIGLGFLCPDKGIYGLAHVLLPWASRATSAKGQGRHVDGAVQSLLDVMEIKDAERKQVNVILAGGANMTMMAGADPSRLVGSANARSAKSALRTAGLRVSRDETGGQKGRRIHIDCDSGAFTIETIPRLGDTT